MLGLALAQRSFSTARFVLPSLPLVSRWSTRRYNSTNAGEASGQIEAKPPAGASSTPALDPSQLPLPNTPDISQGPFREETYAASYVPGRSIHLPFLHPKTHAIPVATIHFRSYHTELLELFTHFASHAATALGIPISRVVKLPTQRSLWTVPRSPFVHKKSQENFERKVHKRLIKAWDADDEVVERWVMYLKQHGLGGVGMRIVRWQRTPLGIGRRRLEGVRTEVEGRQAEIRKMGENIIKTELSQ